MAKFTWAIVRAIRTEYGDPLIDGRWRYRNGWPTSGTLAVKYNCTPQQINDIVKCRIWVERS